MNNLFVYLEIEDGIVKDVSLELLTKGRSLTKQLNCKLEAVAIGHQLENIPQQVFPYGVDVLHLADDKRFVPYTTQPHASVLIHLFKEEKPQIALLGATSVGRDLGQGIFCPFQRVNCRLALLSKLATTRTKPVKFIRDLFTRFARLLVAISWLLSSTDCRPQMATIREGVMKNFRSEIFWRNSSVGRFEICFGQRFCN